MRKLLILFIFGTSSFIGIAQSNGQSCDKKSCGPEGTKKEEAAVIGSMRNDLQSVISKLAKSTLGFDQLVKEMKIEKGASDDESLLFLSHAATSIRYELLNKIESAKLIASLKDFKPSISPSKQQMVADLKKEIQLIASQADKL